MSRLLDPHQVKEFRRSARVPPEAITTEIIDGVRKLHETKHIEPFLCSIIGHPSATPHGPTEIADILTWHLHVDEQPRLAAVVLKGKSLHRVSSRKVAHQFAKVRQVRGLGLVVFLAVGDIQDDATRDFVQMARDAECDYVFVDATDCARLFIAHKKICHEDGTPYGENGICLRGHKRPRDAFMRVPVTGEPRCEILGPEDLSHAGAKRYSAIVVGDPAFEKELIREIIRRATEQVRVDPAWRPATRDRWGDAPPHVVWLFVAGDRWDVRNANWICRTSWIDSSLPQDMRPTPLRGDERVDDIEIAWNDGYDACRDALAGKGVLRGAYLRVVRPVVDEVVQLGERASQLFQTYRRAQLPEREFVSRMQNVEGRAHELYRASLDFPLAPEDCGDYDQACQRVCAMVADMFHYYSSQGLDTRPKEDRDWLMASTLKRFDEDVARMRFEEEKLP